MSTITNQLTTGEVAQKLGWSPRFIDSLVRTDKLPSSNINGETCFDRSELIDWFEAMIRVLDHEQVVALDNQIAGRSADQDEFDPVTVLLSKSGIVWDGEAVDQSSVLAQLARMARETAAVSDERGLLQSLIDREQLCSTALPGGVAICHPRDPHSNLIHKPFIRLLRTAVPVPFGAEDLKPTSLFFLLGSTSPRAHLKTLSRLARILDDDTKGALHAAKSAAAAYQLIAGREVIIHRKRQAWMIQNPDHTLFDEGS